MPKKSATEKLKVPGVLAFERKLAPSDARLYSTTWEQRNEGKEQPLRLVEKSVRGTISNRLTTGKGDDPAKIDAGMRSPNLQKVDSCNLPEEHDTLIVSFSLKIHSGLGDYVHRTKPRPTPLAIQNFAVFARRQPKASPERLIRRAMKRQGIDEADAIERYEGYTMDRCRLPWVDMRSESSQHRFRLFIDRIEMPGLTSSWGFSTYGLSRSVSMPLF